MKTTSCGWCSQLSKYRILLSTQHDAYFNTAGASGSEEAEATCVE